MNNDLSSRQKMTVDLRKQINRHASIMLQKLIREGNGKNVVSSPLAAYLCDCLGMLSFSTSQRYQYVS